MRLSLAMLPILFGLPFLATAEYIRVSAAEDPVPLKLADGRTILLDGCWHRKWIIMTGVQRQTKLKLPNLHR